MPARRRKSPEKKRRESPRDAPRESPDSDTITVAWTVSVTAVVLADVMAAFALWLAGGNPGAAALAPLAGILLFSAAAMGVICLTLLPIVWQKRRVKPPQGYVVFALFASAAPIAWTIARLLR